MKIVLSRQLDKKDVSKQHHEYYENVEYVEFSVIFNTENHENDCSMSFKSNDKEQRLYFDTLNAFSRCMSDYERFINYENQFGYSKDLELTFFVSYSYDPLGSRIVGITFLSREKKDLDAE
jgi:hypothetical protein